MSNINDAFPSKYLKANDLKGNRVSVTMSHVDYETIAEERKAVLFFRGKEKGLVLNKTNASMIVELTGTTETDDWAGHRVVLYPTRVDYQGKRVDAIRIDAAPAENGRKAAPSPPPPPEPGTFDSDEDSTPF
jgi:hypothetical protein